MGESKFQRIKSRTICLTLSSARVLILGRVYSGQELQPDQQRRKNDRRFSGPAQLRRHGAGLRQERRHPGAEPHEDK